MSGQITSAWPSPKTMLEVIIERSDRHGNEFLDKRARPTGLKMDRDQNVAIGGRNESKISGLCM